MTRNLFIIAGASLVLSLACLGGAAALGGADLRAHDWTWVISDDEAGPNDRVSVERGDLGPDVTRTLAWNGDQSLTVDTSADVTYVQGAKAGVVVRGPKSAVDRVRLVAGRLTMDDGDDYAERVLVRWGPSGIHGWSEGERLKITVTAPNVDRFRLGASGDLTIEGYDRPTMEVMMDGSGDVTANGRAGKLTVRTNASGDADLTGLEVSDADIDNAGSGEIEVGPRGKAKVDISGSGDVRLTRKPASVEQNIDGSGELEGA
jgi:hypothetical protein